MHVQVHSYLLLCVQCALKSTILTDVVDTSEHAHAQVVRSSNHSDRYECTCSCAGDCPRARAIVAAGDHSSRAGGHAGWMCNAGGACGRIRPCTRTRTHTHTCRSRTHAAYAYAYTYASRSTLHGARFTAHASWRMLHGECFTAHAPRACLSSSVIVASSAEKATCELPRGSVNESRALAT